MSLPETQSEETTDTQTGGDAPEAPAAPRVVSREERKSQRQQIINRLSGKSVNSVGVIASPVGMGEASDSQADVPDSAIEPPAAETSPAPVAAKKRAAEPPPAAEPPAPPETPRARHPLELPSFPGRVPEGVDPTYAMLLQQQRELFSRTQPAAAPAVDPYAAEIARAVREKDYDALQRHGVSLDEWNKRVIGENPLETAFVKQQREIEELRKWKAQQESERQTWEQQQQQRARDQELDRVRSDISVELEKTPQGKLLTKLGGVSKVMDKITQYAWETQRVWGRAELLDIREAVKLVQEEQRSQLVELAREFSAVPEIQTALAPPKPKTPAPRRVAPTSITSGQVSGVAPARAQTAEERRARALAVMTQQQNE